MSQAKCSQTYRAKSVAKFMSAIGMSSTKHRSIILPMRQVITSGFMSIPSAPQRIPYGATIAHGYLTLSLYPMLRKS